jgi:hypothetical protein
VLNQRSSRTPRQAAHPLVAVVGATLVLLGLLLPAFAGSVAAVEGPTKLFDPAVSPASGTTATTIVFAVSYRNREGSAPDHVTVIVDGTAHAMQGDGGSNWKQGVRHTWSARLAVGVHTVSFEAADTRKFSDAIDGGSVTISAPPPPSPTPTPPPDPTPTPAPTDGGGSGSGGSGASGGSGGGTGSGDGGAPTGADDGGAPTGGGDGGSTGTDGTGGAPGSSDGSGASTGSGHGSSLGGITGGDVPGEFGYTDTSGSAIDVRNGSGGSDGANPDGDSNGSTPSDGSAVMIPGAADSGSGPGTGGSEGSAGSGGPRMPGLGGLGWGSLANVLQTLGIDQPRTIKALPMMVGTGSAVTLAFAFAIFGKKRRDEQPPAPDEVLQASAAQGYQPLNGSDTVNGVVRGPAVPQPVDLEAGMPRWRRPSLMEARKADPNRTSLVTPRLSFDNGLVGAVEGRERRVIRYRVVRLLDAPDELRSADIGQLDQGDEVQLLERSGSYWLVLCPDGRQGWLHKMTLGEIVSDAAPTGSWGSADVDSDVLSAFLEARARA